MSTKDKLILAGVCIIASLVILSASFVGGVYTGYKVAMDKHRAALAEAGELYSESERLNRQLELSNTDLQRINNDAQQEVERLRESLKLAGKGISGLKEGNADAQRLIRDLNDIIQSVEGSQ